MKNFKIKPTVVFDTTIQEYFATLTSKSVFVVADPMMEKLGIVDQIKKSLDSRHIPVTVFSEITPDPKVETIAKGLAIMNGIQPEHLVAIGGGSAIDAAKGILLGNYKLSTDYEAPILIAIPSTSGTGSEVTSFTVITNGEEKTAFVDERLIPNIALLDVELVKSVPVSVTIDTGMDVLTHAIEAYVSTDANSFTDALAEKAVQMVFENLPKLYRDPNDSTARRLMHDASTIAGMAFTNASLGINHSIAHAIGGVFHLSHGRINAVIMARVIQYNASGCQQAAARYQRLAKLIGLPAQDAMSGVAELCLAIQVLNQEFCLPTNFREFGVEEAAFVEKADQIAYTALADACTLTNPRKPDHESLKDLYLSMG